MKAPVPAKLPHLQTIIQNLGQPVDALAKFLDISPQTMRRYIREGQAPRPVMLAMPIPGRTPQLLSGALVTLCSLPWGTLRVTG